MKKRYEYKRGYLIDHHMDYKIKCSKALADDVMVNGWQYFATSDGFWTVSPAQKVTPEIKIEMLKYIEDHKNDWHIPNKKDIDKIC